VRKENSVTTYFMVDILLYMKAKEVEYYGLTCLEFKNQTIIWQRQKPALPLANILLAQKRRTSVVERPHRIGKSNSINLSAAQGNQALVTSKGVHTF
jgi:hypothetical protein